jgi:hypothetical protein
LSTPKHFPPAEEHQNIPQPGSSDLQTQTEGSWSGCPDTGRPITAPINFFRNVPIDPGTLAPQGRVRLKIMF